MQVGVEIERSTEPLHDDHGASPRVNDARLTGPSPEESEDGAHRDGRDRPTQVMVPRQQVAQRMWERQHPLSHRHVREDVVAQMGGALGHPPSGTAGTHGPPLTGEGDEPVGPARPAVKPRETAGEVPTAEKVAELPLDKPRDRLSVAGVRGLREEGLEVVVDERVEHALVRCPRSVRDGRAGHPAGRRRDCADLNLREKRRVGSPRCQVLPRGATPRSADSPTARKPNFSGPMPARTAIRSPAGVSLHEGTTGRLGATGVIVNSEAVLFRTLAAVV